MVCAETAEFFGATSPLRQASQHGGTDYEVRPQQAAMAQAVAAALAERRVCCIEAPTGVGKTFAYLVPALFHVRESGTRVVISTHTINLQQQIIGRDLPLLEKLLNETIAFAIAKGRSNYLCLRRLSQLANLEQTLLPGEHLLGEMAKLLRWSSSTSSGDSADLPAALSPQLWQAVCCERGNCLMDQCDFFGRCFLMRAKRRIREAQIIVANHAFFFSALAMQEGLDDPENSLLPKFSGVVLDEGHTIEETAASHLGLRAETYSIRRVLNRLYLDERRPGLLAGDRGAVARRLVSEVRGRSELFFSRLLEWIQGQSSRNQPLRYTSPGHIANYLDEPVVRLLQELQRLLSEMPGDRQEEGLEIKAAVETLQEQNEALGVFFSMGYPDHVYWFELQGRESGEIVFNVVPVDVSERLRSVLFEAPERIAVVITSATLAVNGSIEFFKQRIGAEQAESLLLDSPFDFTRQARLFLGRSLPAPDTPGFLEQAESHLRFFLERSSGSAFILCTSYAMMQNLYERLEPFLLEKKFPPLLQGEKHAPARLLEIFKKTPRSVLFGTASFWTGVDVAGEALSNVIITKLPFAVPDHPLTAARCEHLSRQGLDPFQHYSLPEAVLKFRQGFGRLIRTREDTGIIVVLDSRICRKHYGRVFLDSLPSCATEYF